MGFDEQETELIRAGDSGSPAVYVLNLRFSSRKLVYADQMKEVSGFQELLGMAKDFRWKTYTIKTPYKYLGTERRTCFTTSYQTADGATQHLLYFCQIEPSGKGDGIGTLSLEWIKLRADGSVHSAETDVEPRSHEQFTFQGARYVFGLRALKFMNRRMFLLWEDLQDGKSKLHGFALDVGVNGEVPNPREWKQLDIKPMPPFEASGEIR